MNFGKSKKIVEKNLDDYCLFIREHYNKIEFREVINKIRNIRGNKKGFEFQTMRMTIFG
jgi:hypothetical protein